uniref:Putative protease Do-like protein 14 n=1 Tax=Aegilops tauschii TaxID=37682 RepID=M8BEN3_AEGTA
MAAGPEEVQAKKMNPGQEEDEKKDSLALLPMPGGRPGCFIDPRWLTAKIAKDKLDAAKSDIGSKPLKRCSGLLIDWDEESKTCVVLTTAHLIRTEDSPVNVWLGGEEYTSNADVTVHLLDGTSEKGQLLYYQPHYDLAFVRVKVDQPIQLSSFSEEVTFAEEVLRLGRDNMLDLWITYGRAAYQNPDIDERYHYMYFDCADDDNDDDEYDNGGLVISLDGKIVGMFNISSRGSFIPSSILLSCVDLWKKYGRIPRPQLGMTFEAIKLLEPAHVDKIWCMCHIDDGLVVQEVLKGSPADKFGIERGDIVECFNGEPISNTVELENRLMNTCKGLSDNYNDLVEVHVSVVVFHTLKKQRRIGELTVAKSVTKILSMMTMMLTCPERISFYQKLEHDIYTFYQKIEHDFRFKKNLIILCFLGPSRVLGEAPLIEQMKANA